MCVCCKCRERLSLFILIESILPDSLSGHRGGCKGMCSAFIQWGYTSFHRWVASSEPSLPTSVSTASEKKLMLSLQSTSGTHEAGQKPPTKDQLYSSYWLSPSRINTALEDIYQGSALASLWLYPCRIMYWTRLFLKPRSFCGWARA